MEISSPTQSSTPTPTTTPPRQSGTHQELISELINIIEAQKKKENEREAKKYRKYGKK